MNAPAHVRCYDNGGKTFDRFTVVFTRLQGKVKRGTCLYVGMSAEPFHPQGFGQHGEAAHAIDRPRYSHLGKRIDFAKLPADCQKLVRQTYSELWSKKS